VVRAFRTTIFHNKSTFAGQTYSRWHLSRDILYSLY